MRVHLLAVGRLRAGPERDLLDTYLGRITLWPVTMREVEEKKPLPPERLKMREAELLLAAVPDGAVVVALDERGKDLGSRDIAGRIRDWAEQGTGDLCFVIGGADGLAPSVRERAQLVLRLGAPTWPHMLVRALLAEQLYRAQCITTGHPYHRD